MKNISLLLILFIYQSVSAQNSELEKLLSNFNKIEMPFNTSNYNRYIKNELSKKLALEFIFNGDSASAFYSYALYSDDDNTLTESGKLEYRILPVDYFTNSSGNFITYYKGTISGESGYYLSILNVTGHQSDCLLIYQEQNENEFYKWVRAKISIDSVLIYEYNYIPKKQRTIENQVTKINAKHYLIDDENKRFILKKEDVFYSTLFISDLYKSRNDTVLDIDPFNY